MCSVLTAYTRALVMFMGSGVTVSGYIDNSIYNRAYRVAQKRCHTFCTPYNFIIYLSNFFHSQNQDNFFYNIITKNLTAP